jgi:hypothetical protein
MQGKTMKIVKNSNLVFQDSTHLLQIPNELPTVLPREYCSATLPAIDMDPRIPEDTRD